MHAILILATVLGLAASPTRAPSAEEQRLYDDGVRAFQAGDARGAEKAWKAGYAVAHDPAFLIHIGEAQEKAGAPAEAADSYRRYLREAPDAIDRAEIEQRLMRLAPPAAGPATPVPGTPPAPDETPGEFGASPARPSLAPPAPPASTTAPAGDTERPGGPAQPQDSGWNRYNITAVATASAAVLLLGAAALYAAKASSDSSDVNRLLIYRDPATGAPLRFSSVAPQYEQATADGPDHERAAKILLGASAAVAAVSITFFILDEKLGPKPEVAIAPDGRGGVAARGGLQWRF